MGQSGAKEATNHVVLPSNPQVSNVEVNFTPFYGVKRAGETDTFRGSVKLTATAVKPIKNLNIQCSPGAQATIVHIMVVAGRGQQEEFHAVHAPDTITKLADPKTHVLTLPLTKLDLEGKEFEVIMELGMPGDVTSCGELSELNTIPSFFLLESS